MGGAHAGKLWQNRLMEREWRPLGWGEIRFVLHGVRSVSGQRPVDAGIFSQKLGKLIKALRAADKSINGAVKHSYYINGLSTGSAVIELAEETPADGSWASGIDAFDKCIEAVVEGSRSVALNYGQCTKYLENISRGASHTFGYGEMHVNGHLIVRIDELFSEQAKTIIENEKQPPERQPVDRWFKGSVPGAFDGEIKEVDLRGSLPQLKLILSAGGQEIDCVFRENNLNAIRECLNMRVRIEGMAFYDGNSGLPRRLTVTNVSSRRKDVDFGKWGGTFDKFDSDWIGDIE